MKTEHIIEIIVNKEGNKTTFEGGFTNSTGVFSVEVIGEGNAARHEITLWGGQYDMDEVTKKIVIYGEWEMAEVAELFTAVAKANE